MLAYTTQKVADHADIHHAAVMIDALPTIRLLGPGNLIQARIENGRPKYPESLLGCLDRLVLRQNRELVYELKPAQMQQTIYSPMDALIINLKSLA